MFNPIDFVLHIDKYIGSFISNYGSLTYLILFIIILLETGLVVTPFLPGDSLLFVAGTFAAQGSFSIGFLFALLLLAAIVGDNCNYFIGKFIGTRVFLKRGLIKKEYIEKTEYFFKKYGGKTVILARFMPIVRTFAPFVAGVGNMNYRRFLFFDVIGGLCWVGLFLFAGYFLGSVPFVKKHLTEVILLIIFVSILPPIVEYIRSRKNKR